MGHLVCFTD